MAQVVDDDSDMVVHLALLLQPEREAEVRFPNSPTPAPAVCLRKPPWVAGTEWATLATVTPSLSYPRCHTLPWSSTVWFETVPLSVCP